MGRGMKYFMLLFGVVFTAASVVIFFLLINPAIENKQIAASGTPATAIISGFDSNMSSNDEPIYFIRLSLNGKTLFTNTNFTANELNRIGNIGDEVSIKYRGDKAIIVGYNYDGAGWRWLFFLPFAAVGIGTTTAFFVMTARQIKDRLIYKNGKDGTGTYLSHDSDLLINDSPIYFIKFSFVNDDGRLLEMRTGTIFSHDEAEAIAAMKQFPIKYMGDRAAVVKSDMEDEIFMRSLKNPPTE